MNNELEPPDDDRLLEIALRVTDDAPVDWEATREQAAGLSDTLEWMQRLQTLAELHRRSAASAGSEKPAFTWGPLRAIEKIGEGAFGEVWRAWDSSLQREVALKLRRPELDSVGASRWLREAQRLARVRHPHVLTVYGADVHDGRAGMWSDLVRGRTVEQVLVEQGPFGPRELVAIGLDLCAALAAIHGAGLVHGDIKTGNVMREGIPLGRSGMTEPVAESPGFAAGAGRIVVMDFGTASERAAPLSGTGAPGATPLFAAPELLERGTPSVASDLYATGVLLYRLASGRFPVEAKTIAELRERHARRDRTPLRSWRPDLPGALIHVIERALAPDPALRFADAAELEHALAAVFAPPGLRRDGAGVWRFASGMLAGVLIAGIAVAAFVKLRAWSEPRFRLASNAQVSPFTLEALVPERELHQWGGYCSTALGDIDGDGHLDLASSAPWEDGGRVHVLLGDGHCAFPRSVTLRRATQSGGFGFALSAGDLNGDGHPDLAVSSWDNLQTEHGTVELFWGGSGFDDVADFVIAEQRGGMFGYSLACGDWNRDGTADLAVGATLDKGTGHEPTGRVYVYFGGPHLDVRPNVELGCDSPGAEFGVTVDMGGDLNGDGVSDLAIGAQGESTDGVRAGRTYVYYGGSPPSTRPDLVLHGPGPWHSFGPAHFVGDLDEDGFDDLLVADERGDGFQHASGVALLFRGARTPSTTPALVFKGEREGDGYGRWATAAGDVNGDGHPDLAIGAWWSDVSGPTSGAVYVYHGGPHMSELPALQIAGPAPGDRFGCGLANAGDLDGDGFSELLIGAPAESSTSLGGQYLVRFHRYLFLRPREGESWRADQPAVVSWQGDEPARIEWSSDGRSWQRLRERVGGNAKNLMRVSVPAAPGDSLRLRLTPAGARIRGEAISPVVRVMSAR